MKLQPPSPANVKPGRGGQNGRGEPGTICWLQQVKGIYHVASDKELPGKTVSTGPVFS
jgi:hypothetical protein